MKGKQILKSHEYLPAKTIYSTEELRKAGFRDTLIMVRLEVQPLYFFSGWLSTLFAETAHQFGYADGSVSSRILFSQEDLVPGTEITVGMCQDVQHFYTGVGIKLTSSGSQTKGSLQL